MGKIGLDTGWCKWPRGQTCGFIIAQYNFISSNDAQNQIDGMILAPFLSNKKRMMANIKGTGYQDLASNKMELSREFRTLQEIWNPLNQSRSSRRALVYKLRKQDRYKSCDMDLATDNIMGEGQSSGIQEYHSCSQPILYIWEMNRIMTTPG